VVVRAGTAEAMGRTVDDLERLGAAEGVPILRIQ